MGCMRAFVLVLVNSLRGSFVDIRHYPCSRHPIGEQRPQACLMEAWPTLIDLGWLSQVPLIFWLGRRWTAWFVDHPFGLAGIMFKFCCCLYLYSWGCCGFFRRIFNWDGVFERRWGLCFQLSIFFVWFLGNDSFDACFIRIFIHLEFHFLGCHTSRRRVCNRNLRRHYDFRVF